MGQCWKWDSSGICNVSSCTTLTVCHNRPLLRSWCLYIYFQLTLNVIQQASPCVLNVECGGRGEVCGGRGGGVWWEGEVCKSGEGMWDRGAGYREQVGGVRCVVSEVEGCGRVGGMCGGRGGGEFRRVVCGWGR